MITSLVTYFYYSVVRHAINQIIQTVISSPLYLECLQTCHDITATQLMSLSQSTGCLIFNLLLL